jgi:hypothetical protein
MLFIGGTAVRPVNANPLLAALARLPETPLSLENAPFREGYFRALFGDVRHNMAGKNAGWKTRPR